MSNVLGPYDQAEWETLKLLKASIELMKKTNASEYKEAIEKEEKIYKAIMKKAA